MKLQRFLSLTILLSICLLLAGGSPIKAQSYSYEIPTLKMQVYVQPDASVHIVYDITFKNRGSAIEIIDIGTPHDNYDIGNMRASINGVNLSDIRKSTYIDTGVEVHLGSQAIKNGKTGTLHFEFDMPDLVYQDTTNKEYASLQITPTWFDSSSISGSTDIWVAIHMLEGIEADEILYQKVPFIQKAFYQNRVAAIWNWPGGKATGAYLVGVSFPKRGMEHVVTMTLFQLVNKYLTDNPRVWLITGVITAGLLTLLFFRFTGGTGCALYAIIGAGVGALLWLVPFSILFVFPIILSLIAINETKLKRRKKTYLPPIAQVEGGGIKRGLTAPEAATLLEMPLNKVLTLTIFGLLAKGVLSQTQDDPLVVEVVEEFRAKGQAALTTPNKRYDFLKQAAQAKGIVIHRYEEPFLYLIESGKGKAVKDINFGPAITGLITRTAEKMKGFDLSDTQEYYQKIIARAWQQAQLIGEIPQREEFLDKYLPWVLMRDDYPTVLTTGGYHYSPAWIRPMHHAAGGGKAVSSGGKSGVGGRTTLGDVGASFAGWAQTTMGSMASAVMPGSVKVPGVSGGMVDLSGLDKVTGDIFEAMAKSSGSSGSGRSGGGCACACAGCACACACAGGGR